MGYIDPTIPGIDHRDDHLTVLQMVKNRLIWVKNTEGNDQLISNFIYEVMAELELCFRIRFDKATGQEDWDRVGQEIYYHTLMRSIVADIVCVYILTMLAAALSTGDGKEDGEDLDSDSGSSRDVFMSSAKAGSVQVDYEQFKTQGTTVLGFEAGTLLNMYRKAAIRKAANLGCVIDILEDNAVKILELTTDMTKVKPFMVTQWGRSGAMRVSSYGGVEDCE